MTPTQYKAERTKRGLSQAQLADALQVSRQCINRREAGDARYPITREAELAILGLPTGLKFIPVPKADPRALAAEREVLARLANPQLKRK
jgi:transcriptional regulator with XRE-family HTH domain